MAGNKIQKYVDLFIKLLPRGKLWKPKEQPVFLKLINSLMTEFCRVDDKIVEMKRAVDPRTAGDSIDLWESMLGLPDECTPSEQTEQERIDQVVQKFTNIGGLSKNFYEYVGAQLGFPEVEVKNWRNFVAGRGRAGDPITNYWDRTFVAGSLAGDPLKDIGWLYYFNVELPASASFQFVAGSLAGDPLREFGNELLECTYKQIKPANAGITFSFK